MSFLPSVDTPLVCRFILSDRGLGLFCLTPSRNKLLTWPASIPGFEFRSLSSSSPFACPRRFVVLSYLSRSLSYKVRFKFEFRFASSSGSIGLLIARCASVSTYCPRSRYVHILDIVHVLHVSSSFVLRRLSFGSSYQFRFASSSGSLLSFGSAILLIARCASVRICCPHSQLCPRPRFVHILVPAPVLSSVIIC